MIVWAIKKGEKFLSDAISEDEGEFSDIAEAMLWRRKKDAEEAVLLSCGEKVIEVEIKEKEIK